MRIFRSFECAAVAAAVALIIIVAVFVVAVVPTPSVSSSCFRRPPFCFPATGPLTDGRASPEVVGVPPQTGGSFVREERCGEGGRCEVKRLE